MKILNRLLLSFLFFTFLFVFKSDAVRLKNGANISCKAVTDIMQILAFLKNNGYSIPFYELVMRCRGQKNEILCPAVLEKCFLINTNQEVFEDVKQVVLSAVYFDELNNIRFCDPVDHEQDIELIHGEEQNGLNEHSLESSNLLILEKTATEELHCLGEKRKRA